MCTIQKFNWVPFRLMKIFLVLIMPPFFLQGCWVVEGGLSQDKFQGSPVPGRPHRVREPFSRAKAGTPGRGVSQERERLPSPSRFIHLCTCESLPPSPLSLSLSLSLPPFLMICIFFFSTEFQWAQCSWGACPGCVSHASAVRRARAGHESSSTHRRGRKTTGKNWWCKRN